MVREPPTESSYHHQKRERQTANLLFLFGSRADALQQPLFRKRLCPLYGTGERGLRQCEYQRIFSQESIDRWRAASADPNGLNEYGVPNYVAYPNTDWFDEVFDTGYSQEHNLSVSGSSEKVKYMLSLGYLDNQES